MSDNGAQTIEDLNQERMQEEYLKTLEELEEGQLIEGRVIEGTDETVFVDVGYKSEGKIRLEEFDSPPQIDDVVHVILISKEGKEGQVIVSKKKADSREKQLLPENVFSMMFSKPGEKTQRL